MRRNHWENFQREYNNSKGKSYPMFMLTTLSKKQVLHRESKLALSNSNLFRSFEENNKTRNRAQNLNQSFTD
jgi:hypothetical protein